jgi:hypothetical protein
MIRVLTIAVFMWGTASWASAESLKAPMIGGEGLPVEQISFDLAGKIEVVELATAKVALSPNPDLNACGTETCTATTTPIGNVDETP